MTKVLCVDDDKVTLMVYKRLLKKIDNVDWAAAENGLEAIAHLSSPDSAAPDIILLDINMPVMNAWGFLKEYEKTHMDQMPETKIYVVSSTVDPTDKEKALSFKSVIGFVPKPITEASITSLVLS